LWEIKAIFALVDDLGIASEDMINLAILSPLG
jgi:hypothetical protein